MTTESAISVRGLHKRYGEIEAVAGVDLTVQRGEVFALLGPNGAGKTTAVEIMEGHRQRDAGEVSVLGYDPGRHETAFLQRIGIVLQSQTIEPYLKVEETLEMFRAYFPHPRPLDELLDLVGLTEQRHQRVKKLSGGQQRRLDVAIGLAGDPDLLFLDEPTTGFDPAARRGAWEMVRGLQALGKTILLTTHYMEEAEYLAGSVAIINHGRIVAEGTPSQLIGSGHVSVIRFRLPGAAGGLLAGLEGVKVTHGGAIAIETPAPTAVLYELTRRAHDLGVELPELSVTRPSLEEIYLRLVGGVEVET